MQISRDDLLRLHSAGITDEHIANLITLADFLESDKIPPPQFDINSYVDNDDLDLDDYRESNKIDGYPQVLLSLIEKNVCGTTACAVGHAPLIKGMEPHKGETWIEYEYRLFGVSQAENYSKWLFMFGQAWRGANNTAKGTAARIRFFLTQGDEWEMHRYEYYNNYAPWITDEIRAAYVDSGEAAPDNA